MATSKITLLLAAALVGCCVALPNGGSDTEVDNSTLIYPSDLPPSEWTREKVEDLKKALSEFEDVQELGNETDDEGGRVERAVGANSHWCCLVNAPVGTDSRYVTTAYLDTYRASFREVYKCGFLAMGICYRTIWYDRYEMKTRSHWNYYSVRRFPNGCPRDRVKCCSGYASLPGGDNCIATWRLDAYNSLRDRLARLRLLKSDSC